MLSPKPPRELGLHIHKNGKDASTACPEEDCLFHTRIRYVLADSPEGTLRTQLAEAQKELVKYRKLDAGYMLSLETADAVNEQLHHELAEAQEKLKVAEKALEQRKSWQKCRTHGEINADHAWGCPDCVAEMRTEIANLQSTIAAWNNAEIMKCGCKYNKVWGGIKWEHWLVPCTAHRPQKGGGDQ